MPPEYDSTTELLAASLRRVGITLVNIKNVLNAKYKKLQARKKKSEEADMEEMVLNSMDVQKCKTCRKLGHQAANCFKDPKNCAKYEE